MPETLPTRLNALRAKSIAALVRHARDPRRFGASDEHERYWFACNAVRYALAEGNTVFAGSLLPATGEAARVGEGLPVLPTGVRWAVDEAAPGTVTLTVDVAAAAGVTARVEPPETGPFVPVVAAGPTRLTTTFTAPDDGIHIVSFFAGGTTPLFRVYVPVTRALFRSLREDSRQLAYSFRRALPPAADPVQRLRLALLIAGESAAQTRQLEVAVAAHERAEALPQAPAPTAIYPSRRG